MFQIGTHQLKKGTKLHAMLPVYNHSLELPFCAICGEQKGPVAVVSAGIHGAEYIGIQTAMELSREIEPSRINGTLIFLLAANPQAVHSFTRLFVPEDGKNLNRMFPGKKEGTLSEKIAYTIEKELHSQADYYIDLHAGDTHEQVMPFVYYAGTAKEQVCEISRKMAEATKMPVRVRSSATTGSYNYAAIQGVPSILMERGGGGVYSQEEVTIYKKEVSNVLIHLGVLEGEEDKAEIPQSQIVTATYVDCQHQGFWYYKKRPGDCFKKGELLGIVTDVWGNKLQECHGEYDGIVLYETVAMGVNAGDSLIAYGMRE